MRKVWLSLVMGLLLFSGMSGTVLKQPEPSLLSTNAHNGVGN